MGSIFREKTWVESVSIASSDSPSPSSSLSKKSLSNKSIDGIASMVAEESKLKKRRVESILESFITEIKKEKEKEERERRRAEKIERQTQMHKERMQLQQSLIYQLSKIAESK